MNPKKILIVEDEEIIRRLCGRLLSKAGREVILVETVRGAYDAIKNNPLDLLVTDLRLPDGHGVNVIKRFKEKFPEKNAIIITGSPTPEDHLTQIDELNIECIFKPFELPVLEAAVRKALENEHGN